MRLKWTKTKEKFIITRIPANFCPKNYNAEKLNFIDDHYCEI